MNYRGLANLNQKESSSNENNTTDSSANHKSSSQESTRENIKLEAIELQPPVAHKIENSASESNINKLIIDESRENEPDSKNHESAENSNLHRFQTMDVDKSADVALYQVVDY